MATIDARLATLISQFRGNVPLYSERCLKIKDKSGKIVPFVLNKAQEYIHQCLEAQLADLGRVRALLLKGRQQGASTYIGGRFYNKTSLFDGVSTFILTHEQTATDNLFDMVERYHKHNPFPPHTGAANAKELVFDKLEGGYKVGTAGSKAVGRSQTLRLFHGSEVAIWPNAAAHFAGVVQAVPDLPGTEIVLESTANGMSGEFFERWQQAEAGIGDYQAIFVPWFWQDEYSRPVPEDFKLDDDEAEYKRLHGLDDGQMVWRRAKIAELKDPLLFKQEYPATAAEAFQTSGHNSFIPAELVLAARKNFCQARGPLIIGADPARFGDDRFALVFRQGRKVTRIETQGQLSVVDGANWCRQVIDEYRPAKMFIDVGGVGGGVVDILHSWGEKYQRIVAPVNFGGKPSMIKDQGGPRNKRAEMWSNSRDWLEQPGGVDLPDVDEIQSDACGPGYKYDIQQRLLLESKEDMRSRGVRSPDIWDGVALTFAEPVHEHAHARTEALNIPSFGAV